MTTSAALLEGLARSRSMLSERMSATDLVANALRDQIIEGRFSPGDRLPEELIASALSVSRNTIREAFRILRHEGLVTQQLNRGVFVLVPTIEDLVDLYKVRRLVECGAARLATTAPDTLISGVSAAVASGRSAAAAHRWDDVGTADLAFHHAVTRLSGSRRLDDLIGRTFAQLRLVFHTMPDVEEFHSPFLDRNAEIAHLIEDRQGDEAARYLQQYLDDSERQLAAAFEGPRSKSDS